MYLNIINELHLQFIICRDLNYGVGKDGKLPWRLPLETEHYKRMTNGSNLIMGRKTWESIRHLKHPNNHLLVISKTLTSPTSENEHTLFFPNIKSCIQFLESNLNKRRFAPSFVIGGPTLLS